MKKPVKILLSLVALLACALLALMLFVVDSLPGPKEIARAVKTKRQAAKSATASQAIDAKTTTATESLQAEEAAEELTPEEQKKAAQEKIIMAFLDEDPTDIRVCENLGNPSNNLKRMKDADFEKIFGNPERNNPNAEAFRVPLRAIFQDEHLSSLLKDVMAENPSKMDDEEKSSFLQKIDFYGRATYTAAHLYARKKDFETLGDRSIHLSIIAQLANKKPELLENGQLRDACESLQKSIALNDKVDIKSERRDILKLIDEAGLKPADLDFDPDSYLNFKTKISDKQLMFTLDDKDKT